MTAAPGAAGARSAAATATATRFVRKQQPLFHGAFGPLAQVMDVVPFHLTVRFVSQPLDFVGLVRTLAYLFVGETGF